MTKRIILSEICILKKGLHFRLNQSLCLSSERILGDDDPLYADVPKPLRKKAERKPYQTPMKVLIARAKKEAEARKAQPCRMLEHPPDNGLLVPELVEVAHRVYRARRSLLFGLSKLVQLIPLQRCRYHVTTKLLVFITKNMIFLIFRFQFSVHIDMGMNWFAYKPQLASWMLTRMYLQ
jgi:hypothetical protein